MQYVLLAVVLLAVGGGVAFYFLKIRPNSGSAKTASSAKATGKSDAAPRPVKINAKAADDASSRMQAWRINALQAAKTAEAKPFLGDFTTQEGNWRVEVRKPRADAGERYSFATAWATYFANFVRPVDVVLYAAGLKEIGDPVTGAKDVPADVAEAIAAIEAAAKSADTPSGSALATVGASSAAPTAEGAVAPTTSTS